MELTIRENTLELLPQKAVYWKKSKALVIGDLHLGKITHFRNEGIAVPLQALQNNYSRLDEIMELKNVEQIIFIGDLFHSFENSEWNHFIQWREKYHNVTIDLVLGNHDLISSQKYYDAQMRVHRRELLMPPFLFTHKPVENHAENSFVISGHIHPVFRLKGMANQRLRLPCFYFSTNQAILPSFGYFTGGYEIDVEEDSRIFVVVNGQVREVGT